MMHPDTMLFAEVLLPNLMLCMPRVMLAVLHQGRARKLAQIGQKGSAAIPRGWGYAESNALPWGLRGAGSPCTGALLVLCPLCPQIQLRQSPPRVPEPRCPLLPGEAQPWVAPLAAVGHRELRGALSCRRPPLERLHSGQLCCPSSPRIPAVPVRGSPRGTAERGSRGGPVWATRAQKGWSGAVRGAVSAVHSAPRGAGAPREPRPLPKPRPQTGSNHAPEQVGHAPSAPAASRWRPIPALGPAQAGGAPSRPGGARRPQGARCRRRRPCPARASLR